MRQRRHIAMREVPRRLGVPFPVAGAVHDRPDPSHGGGQALAGSQVAGRERQAVLAAAAAPTPNN